MADILAKWLNEEIKLSHVSTALQVKACSPQTDLGSVARDAFVLVLEPL